MLAKVTTPTPDDETQQNSAPAELASVGEAPEIDPAGLLAKNVTDDFGSGEALKINELLYAKGYSASGATTWWNTPSASLSGLTPLQGFRSDERPSQETVDSVRNAAGSEPSRPATHS